ncbi:MAG: immune inhibitor A [Candidatus Cloacimonetes bacterium]|nr:immune inhibitor A [Candidatus Cloacimonadota bacterium]
MKRAYLAVFMLTFLLVSMLSAGTVNLLPEDVKVTENNQLSRFDRTEIYSAGFEDGFGEWTSVDETSPNEVWHLSTTGAFAGSSWWMGDEELGGYASHRYIVMDTPQIVLPTANPTLTFKLNYIVEDPAGAEAPYDGWDGCNVEISTDNGASWSVISGTPAYNCTSLYSFGYEFNEGSGIAGWGGSSNGWVDASFDLSTYAGQNVQIRFAFASDPAYDASDDPTMFGMKVDNINVADVFMSDGEGAAGDNQMIPSALGDVGGDHWAINTTNVHTGNNSVHCPVSPNLLNSVVSPVISIPNTPGDIILSYWTFYELLDSDGDGDNYLEDYYQVFVKPADEVSWTMLHYNYSGLQDLPAEWRLIDQDFADLYFGWQQADGFGTARLNPWAGQDVQIKFTMKTDDNDDGGVGQGFFLDDVAITANIFLPPATGLTAEAEGNQVNLMWNTPVVFTETELAYYDATWVSYISDGQPYAVKITNPYDSEVALTDVNFFMYNTEGTVTGTTDIVVWEDNEGFPGDEIYRVEGVGGLLNMAQTSVDVMQANIMIPSSGNLFVGISNFETTNQGLLAEEVNNQSRSYCSIEGTWMPVSEAYTGLTNIGISANIGTPDPNSPIPDSYSIYRSTTSGEYDEVLGTSNTTMYTDNSPFAGTVNYYVVRANYEQGTSAASNEAFAYVMIETATEYIYDDGTSEVAYSAGSGRSSANKFTPDVHPDAGEIRIMQAKIYVHTPGTLPLIVRIWDDNGTDGMPGSTPIYTAQLPVTSLVTGWNFVDLPDLPIFYFTEGSFYIGVLEAVGSSAIGLDNSTNGNSYNDIGGCLEIVVSL